MAKKNLQLKFGSDGSSICIVDANDESHLVPALWLRERSTAESARSRSNYQRLVDPWTLPMDLTLKEHVITNDGSNVTLTFSDDHHCTLTIDDLRDDFDLDDGLPPAIPWTRDLDPLPRVTWKAISNTDVALMEAADAFLRFGFLLISGVPCQDGRATE
ncbi:MAG: gamma-butyrobetaine dioxygenase [Candidatus Kentron sp. G]|nr:MAG: gamma-butyrobetaine dioxygenase [Candidatus Kentron sp. G]VFN07978.1 MAG: gamma-butyrobetaine dioxygenase [Candidatus Kentron sp. G]